MGGLGDKIMSKSDRTRLAKYLYATFLLWVDAGSYLSGTLSQTFAYSDESKPYRIFLYRKLFSFLVDKDGTLYKEISFGYSDIVSDYIVSVTPYREGDRVRSETKIRTITGLKSFERILEGYSLAYVGVTIERLRECLNDFSILDKVESIMEGL